jgi:AraC-like DNA-binding protein
VRSVDPSRFGLEEERTTLAPPTVVAWTPLGAVQERALCDALGARFEMAYCRTEQQLLDAVGRVTVRTLLIQLGGGAGPSASAVIATVKRLFPAILIVGYGSLSHSVAVDILECARAGMDHLALAGFRDIGQVVRQMLAERDHETSSVVHELSGAVPSILGAMLRVFVSDPSGAPNLEQLARRLGVTPRTLQRAAKEGDCCSPHKLLEYVRLLIAARLITSQSLPVHRVSEQAGYAHPSTLSRAWRRHGLPPMRVLKGPADYAVIREVLLRHIVRRDARGRRELSTDHAEGRVAGRFAAREEIRTRSVSVRRLPLLERAV